MNTFCNNPLCRFHVEVPEAVQNLSVPDKDKGRVLIGRVSVRAEGKPDLTLCAVCGNVLVITK